MNAALCNTIRMVDDTAFPELHGVASGTVALFTARCTGKDSPNEDSAALVCTEDGRGAIIMADGFGGLPEGHRASQLAVSAVTDAVEASVNSGGELQAGVLAGFDAANHAVQELRLGAATTLAVVEIDGAIVRPYHVGDSEVMVVGQRGKLKLQTIAHSPVGYSVEAGLLRPSDALHHEERHVVSNMVGTTDMRIDVGPMLSLRPRDTLVVATDGLFDNLAPDEIIQLVRKGTLGSSAAALVARCRHRMSGLSNDGPCKPDDLTLALFRLA
ncbi:MAG: PP2C family protein-serine/threonine phosphatase [Phycisphaerae bacterium]